MRVSLIAATSMNMDRAIDVAYDQTGKVWQPALTDEMYGTQRYNGGLLVEFAGRACYESFHAPNPDTADNGPYIDHLIDVGHTSVLEHGTASFYVTDVSRSLTHELIRHRAGFSYSQQSQRFVRLRDGGHFVTPPLYRGDDRATRILAQTWEICLEAYERLYDEGKRIIAEQSPDESDDKTRRLKRAREAARAVLPNMTPTAIVVTANHTAWRHFLTMRGSIHADAEIRELAIEVWTQLRELEPNLYNDFWTVRSSAGEPTVLAHG